MALIPASTASGRGRPRVEQVTTYGAADVQVTLVQSGSESAQPLLDRLLVALRQAGHQVDEQQWRTVLLHAQRQRPGTDLIVLIEGGPAALPGQLAVARTPRSGDGPTVVLIALDAAAPGRGVDSALRRRLFGAVDAVVTHTPLAQQRARALGAGEVSLVALPSGEVRPDEDLSREWAEYVARLETIAARAGTAPRGAAHTHAVGEEPGLRQRAAATGSAVLTGVRAAARRRRGDLHLGLRDLPDWVRPTDVLAADVEAREALSLARRLGLPWTRRRAAAWAALGAVCAVLRVRDGDRRSSVIVDPAGANSVFSRWISAIGYAPVDLDPAHTEVAAGSLDVIAHLHPDGCNRDDIDETLARAAGLLRHGGLVCVTVPIGGDSGGAMLLPADLRALVARADDLGLTLVGDLDRDIFPHLPGTRTAYALVRLTLRRTGRGRPDAQPGSARPGPS